jgi:hypothetical protein
VKITELELRNIINESVEKALRNKGSAVICFGEYDPIGDGLQQLLNLNIAMPKFLRAGHATCAIVTPLSASKGKVIAINFGPPVCKKPIGLGKVINKKIPNPIVFSGKVRVYSIGTCKLKNYKITKQSSEEIAKIMKRKHHTGDVRYYAMNKVNAKKCLNFAGKNGRCKMYSAAPTGWSPSRIIKWFNKKVPGERLDIDNCGSFVLDVVSAGRNLKLGSTNLTQLIAFPKHMITVAMAQLVPRYTGKV